MERRRRPFFRPQFAQARGDPALSPPADEKGDKCRRSGVRHGGGGRPRRPHDTARLAVSWKRSAREKGGPTTHKTPSATIQTALVRQENLRAIWLSKLAEVKPQNYYPSRKSYSEGCQANGMHVLIAGWDCEEVLARMLLSDTMGINIPAHCVLSCRLDQVAKEARSAAPAGDAQSDRCPGPAA